MKTISPGNMKNEQSGVVILEALIAILLFSIGILGLVGTLASSVSNASEAQYRTEAAFHAESLIAELRVANPAIRAIDYASPSGGSFVTWRNRVTTGMSALPAAGLSANLPTTAFSGLNNQDVTVTIRWQKSGGTQRTYTVVTSLE